MDHPTPTGRESPFDENEIIVTKTDLTGRITYANEVFLRVSQLRRDQALGKPHSLIRNPAMPRCVFKLLWSTLQARQEFFGYVVNLAANGDHYWVFAHVTPSLGADGGVVGYHSMRRKPEADQVARIVPIYRRLLEEEARHADRKAGMAASDRLFTELLHERKVPYDEFAFSL